MFSFKFDKSSFCPGWTSFNSNLPKFLSTISSVITSSELGFNIILDVINALLKGDEKTTSNFISSTSF